MPWTPLVALAAEEHYDLAIDPIPVGIITFVVLIGLLLSVLMFGKGRDHS